MTSAILWSVVALAALAGWAATLFVVTKTIVPAASALNTLNKVDSFVDDRVTAILERAKRRAQAKTPAQPQKQSPNDTVVSAEDHLRSIFGEDPLFNTEPILEQPPSDVAAVEAHE